MRFSINREPAVALQNSRHELVPSAEKIFQSLSSHRFLSGITFRVILQPSKRRISPNFSHRSDIRNYPDSIHCSRSQSLLSQLERVSLPLSMLLPAKPCPQARRSVRSLSIRKQARSLNNLALQDGPMRRLFLSSWKWRGCHLSCSAGRRRHQYPLNRWRHHPHQLTPHLACSYSSVGLGSLRRSRWASRHVSETSFPKRLSCFATCTMMSVSMVTGPSQKAAD